MDGLRKVPDNVPNKEMLAQPSRQAADAGAGSVRHASEFGEHNNARLRAFLDTFGFDYEFASRPNTTSPAASTRRC
jgi:lysyl-tRNA synthetase class 1